VNDILPPLMQALRFWSRLPLPVMPFEADPHAVPDMERLAPVVPLAGAVLGLIGALVLAILSGLGLSAMPAAIFAVAVMVVITGAMHEDGLADMADGFGGGGSVARKLEIMKDSRIGSYGACALMLGLAARIALIGGLVVAVGTVHTGLLIVAAFATSRIAGLMPLVLLPPARSDGAGMAVGQLSNRAWGIGAIIGVGLAAILILIATHQPEGLIAPVISLVVALGVTKLAERQIGGQTGDVCGGATLLAEIAFYAAVLAPLGV
jgi:adenosylcobinamide-GDP ribazoletransferase